MRLTAEIPDIEEKVVLDLEHSASMDDIDAVVSHISSHFKNLTVNYQRNGLHRCLQHLLLKSTALKILNA